VIGALLGGLWMVKLGINRALWLFGVVQLVSIFGFAWLAAQGHYDSIGAGERIALAFVIGLEALGVGLGTAAFVAFIARATHPPTLPRKWRCSPAWLPYRAPSSTPRLAGWSNNWAG
jgi:PAT family beta-lactamase induction signal transducer AmpG